MITLAQLNKLAAHLFPKERITLIRILYAWAQEDPGNELSQVLYGTGIDNAIMQTALKPLLDIPSDEDIDLLNRIIITDVDGPVTGNLLLKNICGNPGSRTTRAFVQAGLELSILRRNLEKIKLSSSSSASSILAYTTNIEQEEVLLEKYGRNLISMAKDGLFEDLCDRTDDVKRIMDVLQKKSKGNGALTGPSGVGKTSIVELFARIIVEKAVPKRLRDHQLFEISMGKLLAGTIYRGQFEERLERILNALNACSPAILFIDEMHLIWGAGRTEGSPMDAANMLKPILARGELKILGATTTEEYHQYICRDAALDRRFEEIRLKEPEGLLLNNMLTKQAGGLQKHHHIKISNPVIQKAVELSDQYLPNRWQPDKSIDLMDTASVRVTSEGRSILTEEDLLETLAQLTGQPLGILKGDTISNLKNMAKILKDNIIGQDNAIDKIVATLIYRRQMLSSNDRNMGTFLFSGETGVGKTETGRMLAQVYCGDKKKLLHLDMSEYSQPEGVHKLIGTPRGFVGSEKEGQLTSFLHTYSHGVILFDEIEKAHPKIYRLLLGILDNGRIRSALGEALDTRQSVIILTTNAITPDTLNKKSVGFGNSGSTPDPMDMLTDHFPSEFLGRFDEIILFNRLAQVDLQKILKLRLNEMLSRLEKKKINIYYNEDMLLEYLLNKMKHNKSGARGINRLLERNLMQPISMALLKDNSEYDMTTISLDNRFYKEGKVQIQTA